MAMASSKAFVTLACRNCGRWVVVGIRQQTPFCSHCHLPRRRWRMVTQEELRAYDGEFLRVIERGIEPGAGAKE